MRKKIKLGFLGGGKGSLIGILHRVASGMYDHYELVGGVFNSEFEKSQEFAEELGSLRVYPNIEDLISGEASLPVEERIEAVGILTPNYLHFSMASKLVEKGYHIICEKPLTTSYEEARILEERVSAANTVFAVTYTYTGYPMLRQMKEMIARGDIGKIQKIDIQYYQGWINPIIHDPEKREQTWRLNPSVSGRSCCIGDIGTHAFNMLNYTTGLELKKVLADLNYLYQENSMDVDGTVLLKFSDFVKGIIRTSQIATGEENNFTVSIYGDKAGIKWEQENPNYLYFMQNEEPLKVLKPGNNYNSALSLAGTKLPPGHPEGIFDAMANIYKGVAKAIKGEPYDSAEFPTIKDGVSGMKFIDRVLKSHRKGNVWVEMQTN